MFEVSTLGQPFEVLKTQLAANRGQSMAAALSTIYSRGGILGFFQGLIPWAWIEASTKGAVLLFTASECEYRAKAAGASPFLVRSMKACSLLNLVQLFRVLLNSMLTYIILFPIR
jgi:hypothetical protein